VSDDAPLLDPTAAAIIPAGFDLPKERLDAIQACVNMSSTKGVPFNGVDVLYVSWVRAADKARFSATIIGGFAMAEKFGRAVQRFEGPEIVVIGRKPYQGLPPKVSGESSVRPDGSFEVPDRVVREHEAEAKKLIVP
jgi:hypothetical protein